VDPGVKGGMRRTDTCLIVAAVATLAAVGLGLVQYSADRNIVANSLGTSPPYFAPPPRPAKPVKKRNWSTWSMFPHQETAMERAGKFGPD
jgi:hypothetical protein